ncbi:MAG: 30S ribosomal protein S2, partial [Verrucomicrobia bacterium]|nr:30S ribosomal protein S2 [Verrucomicrobiota bacterium]
KSIKLILQALTQSIIDRKNELNLGFAKGDDKSEEEKRAMKDEDTEEGEEG